MVAQHVNFSVCFDDAGAGDTGPIILEGLAVPWNQTVQLNFWGDTVEFAPGSVAPAGPASRVKLLLDHMNKPFGYGLKFENQPDGLWAKMAIPRDELDNPETATAVRQLRNGVRDALSVGVSLDDATVKEGRAADHYTVNAGQLLELSSVVIPRFDDARVARIAAQAFKHLTADDDPDDELDETDQTDDAGDADDDDEEDDVAGTADTVENRRRGRVAAGAELTEEERAARHRAAMAAGVGVTRVAARGRFASFGHYARAVALGEVDDAYQTVVRAALVDQVTGDTPGLLPEAWIRDVVDIMGAASGSIQAFRSIPLPDAGMVVNIPIVQQHPDVDVQAAEKGPIASRKMLIVPGSFPVKTYAGGQDISIQELLRTDPSYLDILMRAFAVEMAVNANIDVGAAIVASVPVGNQLPLAADDINAGLVAGAKKLVSTTFRFPEVLLLGLNVWEAMANAEDTTGRPLFPTVSPVNPVGTLNLSDNQGNARGLSWYMDPSINPDSAVMGIREAFITMLGPVGTLSSDVPAVLGRDVAVYRFAAFGPTDTRGLVLLTLGAAALEGRSTPAGDDSATDDSSSKSSKK